MAITSINGIDWNNLSSISGIAKASIVGINNVTPPTPGPTGPYKYFVLDVVNTTGITNTTTNTIMYSNLIPANTFKSGGILECLFRIVKNNTLGAYTWRIYTNTTNSVIGGTLIAEFNATTTSRYNETLRYFSLDQGTIKYFGTLGNQTDIGVGTSSSSFLGSAVFDLTRDNYIIFAVQPSTANADVINGRMNFIRGYE